MFFMPFQVLGIWLRGLFSLALLGLGAYLLYAWNERREVVVVEPPARTADQSDRATAPDEEPERRVVEWRFGLNRETAYLLGGAALLLFSLGGGLGVSPRLWRRGGDTPPAEERPAAVQRLRRPDGSELHVELYGPEDAPPVILTHGWGLNNREWCYAREELARHHRLIIWDLPGLGQSSRPADNRWDLEKLAGDLEAVLGLAGSRPAVLLGHSIGGMITLTFCRLFPEALGTRVCGLVLAQSTYTNPVQTTAHAGLYSALQKPVLEPLCHLMVWTAPLLWLLNWLSYLNGSAHRSTERSTFSGRESRGQLGLLTRLFCKAWPGVVARGMLAMFRYDATATLATIPVPTLVVTGERDETCKPEASVFMSRSIPGAKLVTLAEAKHGGVFEFHARFDMELAEFVSACQPATVR